MPELRRKRATTRKELEAAQWQAVASEKLAQLDESLERFASRLRESAQSIEPSDRQKIVRLLVKEIIVEARANRGPT